MRTKGSRTQKTKTVPLWYGILGCVLAAPYAHGQQKIAPFYSSAANTNIFVKTGTGSPHATIAEAVTKACATGGAATVVLLPGADPADSIGSQTEVCDNLKLIDYTESPAITYKGMEGIFVMQSGYVNTSSATTQTVTQGGTTQLYVNNLEGFYYAKQYGNGTTNGIATALAVLTGGGAVVSDPTYAATENAASCLPGISNFACPSAFIYDQSQLFDYRQGAFQRYHVNPDNWLGETSYWNQWHIPGDVGYTVGNENLLGAVGHTINCYSGFPGFDFGSPGLLNSVNDWGNTCLQLNANMYSAGIQNYFNAIWNSTGKGDKNGWNSYFTLKPNLASGSSEGVTGFRLYTTEGPTYTGTVATTNYHGTSLALHAVTNNSWLGVGDFFIDTTNVTTNTLTINSGSNTGVLGTALASAAVSGCTLQSNLNVARPSQAAGGTSQVVETFNLACPSAITTSNLLSLYGGQFSEITRPTAVSTVGSGVYQVTAPVMYSHAAATTSGCSGGAVGSLFEMVPYTTLSGSKYLQQIYCNSTTTGIAFGVIGPNQLSYFGATGVALPINIYQGGEILSAVNPTNSGAVDGTTVTLAPNNGAWTAGDSTLSPSSISQNWHVDGRIATINNPFTGFQGESDIYVGAGINGSNFNAWKTVQNGNPLSMYCAYATFTPPAQCLETPIAMRFIGPGPWGPIYWDIPPTMPSGFPTLNNIGGFTPSGPQYVALFTSDDDPMQLVHDHANENIEIRFGSVNGISFHAQSGVANAFGNVPVQGQGLVSTPGAPARVTGRTASIGSPGSPVIFPCGGTACPLGMYRLTMYAASPTQSGTAGTLTMGCFYYNDFSGNTKTDPAPMALGTGADASYSCTFWSNGGGSGYFATVTDTAGTPTFNFSVVLEKLTNN